MTKVTNLPLIYAILTILIQLQLYSGKIQHLSAYKQFIL